MVELVGGWAHGWLLRPVFNGFDLSGLRLIPLNILVISLSRTWGMFRIHVVDKQ
jgi:hypothetical protein